MTDKIEELFFMTNIYELTARYPEMLEYMKKILYHPQNSIFTVEN